MQEEDKNSLDKFMHHSYPDFGFIKDLIVEDKQGIEQVLKADNCQKHTSFADNFIFFRISC